MSRIRSIHPGFFTDENLVAVSLAARLLFIGAGIEADDKGIFEWKPLTLKMRVFPADNVDVAELLEELVAANAVKRYEMGGRTYGAIRNFRRFQKPKTPNDIHPAFPEILAYVGLISETEAGKVEAFPPKGEKSFQMEDGGGKREEQPDGCSSRAVAREPKPPKPRKTTIPPDWQPERFGDGTKCQQIVDSWPPGEGAAQLERFAAHHTARGNRFESWQAAWKTWVLNSEDFRPARLGANSIDGAGDFLDHRLAQRRERKVAAS